MELAFKKYIAVKMSIWAHFGEIFIVFVHLRIFRKVFSFKAIYHSRETLFCPQSR